MLLCSKICADMNRIYRTGLTWTYNHTKQITVIHSENGWPETLSCLFRTMHEKKVCLCSRKWKNKKMNQWSSGVHLQAVEVLGRYPEVAPLTSYYHCFTLNNLPKTETFPVSQPEAHIHLSVCGLSFWWHVSLEKREKWITSSSCDV